MFENYTQIANWGVDQSFQIYGNGQDESSPEQGSTGSGGGSGGGGGGGGVNGGGGGGMNM